MNIKAVNALLVVFTLMFLGGCDKVNNASRTLDTMLGGDYDVYVQGIQEPFHVINGKVTSVSGKGYYVFYPMIDGKERLVQAPIPITTIIKMD